MPRPNPRHPRFPIPGGPDLREVHSQNFGFGPPVSSSRIHEALDRLENADAWVRIERIFGDVALLTRTP